MMSSLQLTQAEPVDQVTCKLCRRQFSKYTCPTCNVAYCSLTCFRSEPHSQCSETFYKKEVESDIQADFKSPEERLKMLELLKKFEEESSGMENLEAQVDDVDNLASRFGDVDLESTSTDDLWSKLTPVERQRFVVALRDPKSELAQQLLASEELEKDRRAPWWEAPVTVDSGTDSQTGSHRRHGSTPDVIRVPSMLMGPWPNGPALTYNVCAICIAYSYATRHLAISPLSSPNNDPIDIQAARRLMSHLLPFLVDRRSTTLYPHLSQLIPELWSRFEPAEVNSECFALLLHDAAMLIRPLPVTMVRSDVTRPTEIDPTSHPHLNAILVLSDVSKLFELAPLHKATSKAQINHVTHKLMFYAAHILSTPSSVLLALAEELTQRARSYANQASSGSTKKESGLLWLSNI